METKPQTALERFLCGLGVTLVLAGDLTQTSFAKPLHYAGYPIMFAGLAMLIYRLRHRLS
jgi:hypothetical protein